MGCIPNQGPGAAQFRAVPRQKLPGGMLSLPARIQEFHPPANRKSSHAVQFYENDAALIENLGQHTAQSLATGNIAIVIATGPHRAALAEELALRGVDAA